MTAQVFSLVIAAALLQVAATLTLRHGLLQAGGLSLQSDGILGVVLRMLRQWTFLVGMVAYALAALVWFRVLSVAEVSTVYPILVGLTFMLVSVGAVLWFRESISPVKAIGIGVILVGIVVVARA